MLIPPSTGAKRRNGCLCTRGTSAVNDGCRGKLLQRAGGTGNRSEKGAGREHLSDKVILQASPAAVSPSCCCSESNVGLSRSAELKLTHAKSHP